jgi:Fe-S cluster assembly protein SufD
MTLTATKTKAEQGLSRNFEAALARLPGSAFVRQARKAAIGAFATLGLPHRRIEAWKYTDLRALFKEALPPAVGGAEEAPADWQIERALEGLSALDAHRLVFVDGAYRGELSTPRAALPSGASFTPLAAALGSEGEDQPRLADAGLSQQEVGPEVGQAALIALNSAFMSDGAIIDIAEHARLDKPLLLVFVGREGRLVTTRNLITVRAGATATIIEAYVSLAQEVPAQGNTLSKVQVAEGAHLEHVKFTLAGDAATHLATWLVGLGCDASYRTFQLTANTGLARNTLFATFEGERAKLDISGCFLGQGSEHIDTTLVVDHAVPAGESRELIKGVLADRARSVFQGKVIVRPDAQKSDGKQMAQALMLSEQAEFDCKPELEIHADDVICGHGATSSELDRDMLFYLQSRGISLPEARALLIESFVGEVIDKLASETLRSAIWTSAKARLASLAASAAVAEDRS